MKSIYIAITAHNPLHRVEKTLKVLKAYEDLELEKEIDIYINFNAFAAGVLTIGFIFGAYMGETFRGAFMAVDNGQIEAGKAYGMSSALVFRRIRFPQMMRHALPGLSNNWMVLLKTTALVCHRNLSR